ncbi:vWA domain-containing protein [Candidatus Soleaferrea massiliensis]|uniref:vWA domain-containing protein n=1 Tax=Candidatus Soleaferrea massiliensis TaxID=1470354 RepID=UPI00058CC8C9|nr:VWA domain-containing protein [Candidatus Soleaferrea massiliensis]
MQKQVNWLMFFCTLGTGFLGWLLAEYIVVNLIFGDPNNQVPNVLSVGIYFVILTVFGCLGVILSERIRPTYNNFELAHGSFSKRILIAIGAVGIVFVMLVSMLFQFLYSLAIGTENGKSDIVIMMDCSGSLEYGSTNSSGEDLPATDPKRQRIEAAKHIIDTLDETQMVSLIAFTDTAETKFDFAVMSDTNKEKLKAQLEALESDGQTDIQNALDYAYERIDAFASLRNPVVMLFSDGEDSSLDDGDLKNQIRGYLDDSIPVYSVQVNERGDESSVLNSVARMTGGEYTPIEDADEISEAFIDTFNSIRTSSDQNLVLLFQRSGNISGSPLWFFFIRLLCFMFIAGSIGAAYTILLNSKEAIVINILSGLAAGLIMEISTWLFGDFFLWRMIAALLVVAVICRYTVSSKGYDDPYKNADLSVAQVPPDDDPFSISSFDKGGF